MGYKLTAMGVTFDDMSGSKGFFKHLVANFYVSIVFFHVLFSRTVAGELESMTGVGNRKICSNVASKLD